MSSDLLTVTRVDHLVVAGQGLPRTLTRNQVQRDLLETNRQGPPGPSWFPSADAGNRTVLGSDGGVYTPDIETDPLAYYILAKA